MAVVLIAGCTVRTLVLSPFLNPPIENTSGGLLCPNGRVAFEAVTVSTARFTTKLLVKEPPAWLALSSGVNVATIGFVPEFRIEPFVGL